MISCVYEIYNKSKGKRYIGSTNNFKRRIGEHKFELKHNTHHSKQLQEDYNRGYEFEFNIIEECDVKDLRDKEQFYLDKFLSYKTGYNKSKSSKTVIYDGSYMGTSHYGKTNPFYGKHHTEETKKKISQKNSGINSAMYGKKHKLSTIKLMQEKSSGENNSQATKVRQYDLNGNLLREWNCIIDAKKHYGIKSNAISNCCSINYKSDKKHTCLGFVWKYVEKPKRRKK